jgi:hypothetical protein
MVISLTFSNSGDKLAVVFDNEIGLWSISSDLASRFFLHSTADNYIDSKPIPEATANDIPLQQSLRNNTVEVYRNLGQAAGLLQLPVFIPIHLPENLSFQEAIVYSDGSVSLHYDALEQRGVLSSLYIYEKITGNFAPPTMTIGESATVINTQVETIIGSAAAEYVRGDWLWTPSFTSPTSNSPTGAVHTAWQWENTFDTQRLRWQQNGVLIGLYYQVYKPYLPVLNNPINNDLLIIQNTILTKSDLEQIATRMQPLSDIKGINNCKTPTIQTGFDLSIVMGGLVNVLACPSDTQSIQHIFQNRWLVYK